MPTSTFAGSAHRGHPNGTLKQQSPATRLAGILTAIVVWRTRAHLAVWMIIGFIVDGLVISRASPPVWFSAIMLAGISIQALLGYLLASRLFRSRVEPSRA